MINFRYHIVSLTAVFLSLVIGIAMGTTVVSKATVDGLRTNLDRVEARSSNVQAANAELRLRLRDFDKMDDSLEDQMITPAVRDVLTDVPVLVIASKGIDRAALDRALNALVASGADMDGMLLVNDRLLLNGENSDRLAEALGVDPSGDLKRTMLSRLAAVLASAAAMPGVGTTETTTTSSPPTTVASDESVPPEQPAPTDAPDGEAPATTTVPPVPQQPELITNLRNAGFLEFRPMPGDPADGLVLTKTHYRYVVVSGEDADVPDEDFLIPLIRDLASFGPAPLVAASALTGTDQAQRGAFTGALNDDESIKGRISTLDDLEFYAGIVGLVYAVQEVGEGRHGQYGLGPGTSAVLPTVAP